MTNAIFRLLAPTPPRVLATGVGFSFVCTREGVRA
jgi:hypothetical protein